MAGALIRIAALLLPGTEDVGVWKIWTYNGAIHAPSRLYGVGGTPTVWRVLKFNNAAGPVVYPPLGLYELSAVGRAYRAANGGRFPDNMTLTASIKLLIVASEVAFLALLVRYVRRVSGPDAAHWAAIAYWINPAVLLAGSLLGYLDPLYTLPAAAAVFAAAEGWGLTAGALIAAAALTKPQGVILVPVVFLGLWSTSSTRAAAWLRLAWLAVGGAAVTAIVVAPIVAVGGFPNLVLAMSRLAHHDMLSANACNLWWIVGYILRVVYAAHDIGLWTAITMHPRILAISRVIELGYPDARLIGTALTGAAAAWALWTARRAHDAFMLAGIGAFLMHAYATLAAQVHENHLYAAVPLLVIAAAGRREYRPVLYAVSALFALNLNLFYGISEYGFRGRFMIPRSLTIIDLSVLAAVVNCGMLAWHATVLRRACEPPAAGVSR